MPLRRTLAMEKIGKDLLMLRNSRPVIAVLATNYALIAPSTLRTLLMARLAIQGRLIHDPNSL